VSAITQKATRSVRQTCQPLKPYWKMTSSRWRVTLRTTEHGRQS